MKTQRGVGLVEILVSMTIGFFLVLGLGQVFFSMKNTSVVRQQMSAVQNYERTAMMFLENDIKAAGSYPNAGSGVLPSVQFPAVTPAVGGAFALGQPLTGTGANANIDTLSVQFAAPLTASSQGCSAQLTPGDNYIDVFQVSGSYLQCTEIDNTHASTTTINLIGGSSIAGRTIGLTGMNVRYGVDTTGSGSVTEYFKANGMSAANWANVKTVQVQLIFTNPIAGQTATTVNLSQTIPYMNGL
jgi:type IV pilus assembly protein PilW